MGHIIDSGHSISAGASALSKLNARCRLYDPSRTVVHYVIQVCTCQKRSPRFQTNMRVTKSIAMCRIEMKRCRFGVQNGVLYGPGRAWVTITLIWTGWVRAGPWVHGLGPGRAGDCWAHGEHWSTRGRGWEVKFHTTGTSPQHCGRKRLRGWPRTFGFRTSRVFRE